MEATMTKKKYNDDIGDILSGDRKPPALPPPEETLKIRERTQKTSDWGAPDHKLPPPAMTGETEIRHRSPGKGKEGLDHDEKWDMARVCQEIKGVMSHEEAARVAFKLDEKAAEYRRRIEEDRRKRLGNKYSDNWTTRHIQRMEYLAKQMRGI